MQFLEHQLENGLQVIAECNPRACCSAAGFFVRAGARDESDSLSGVSHFLEHMVFKGTERRAAADVNRELDDMAWTTRSICVCVSGGSGCPASVVVCDISTRA